MRRKGGMTTPPRALPRYALPRYALALLLACACCCALPPAARGAAVANAAALREGTAVARVASIADLQALIQPRAGAPADVCVVLLCRGEERACERHVSALEDAAQVLDAQLGLAKLALLDLTGELAEEEGAVEVLAALRHSKERVPAYISFTAPVAAGEEGGASGRASVTSKSVEIPRGQDIGEALITHVVGEMRGAMEVMSRRRLRERVAARGQEVGDDKIQAVMEAHIDGIIGKTAARAVKHLGMLRRRRTLPTLTPLGAAAAERHGKAPAAPSQALLGSDAGVAMLRAAAEQRVAGDASSPSWSLKCDVHGEIIAAANTLGWIDGASALGMRKLAAQTEPGQCPAPILLALAGHTEALRALAAAGQVDVNATAQGLLGLVHAAALAPPSAVEEMLQIALELGASVDGAVAGGASAAEPAEPTASKVPNPLCLAAMLNRADSVRLLQRMGAALAPPVKPTLSCVMCAAMTGSADSLEACLERDVEFNSIAALAGQQANSLHALGFAAAEGAGLQVVDAAITLLQAGEDPRQRTAEGLLPLGAAMTWSQVDENEEAEEAEMQHEPVDPAVIQAITASVEGFVRVLLQAGATTAAYNGVSDPSGASDREVDVPAMSICSRNPACPDGVMRELAARGDDPGRVFMAANEDATVLHHLAETDRDGAIAAAAAGWGGKLPTLNPISHKAVTPAMSAIVTSSARALAALCNAGASLLTISDKLSAFDIAEAADADDRTVEVITACIANKTRDTIISAVEKASEDSEQHTEL